MLNIYEGQDQNKRRSYFIIAAFILFIFTAAYFITQTYGLDPSLLLFSSLFSLSCSLFAFFSGDKLVLSLNGAKPASRQENFHLYTSVENIALAARLPKPAVYLINSPSPNAFATGRSPQHATIAVTTGLLEKLNRSELEAVIAHEMGHIANFDTRLMMLVSVLVGSLSMLADILLRSGMLRGGGDRDKNSNSGPLALIGLFLVILSPLIARLMSLAVSRSREYLADSSSAKLTRQPSALISALKKISADPQVLATAPATTANLYITNPLKGKKLINLFSTHPPIEKRIEKLSQML